MPPVIPSFSGQTPAFFSLSLVSEKIGKGREERVTWFACETKDGRGFSTGYPGFLRITSWLLSLNSLEDATLKRPPFPAWYPDIDIRDVLGLSIPNNGQSREDNFLKEIEALRLAVSLWLQAPVKKQPPPLPDEVPAFDNKSFNRLPTERFKNRPPSTIYRVTHNTFEGGDVCLIFNKKHADFPLFDEAPETPAYLQYIEGYLNIRQSQYSTRLVVLEEKQRDVLIGKNGEVTAKDVPLSRENRSLAHYFSSPWLLPLGWAEILHCVKENIPAQVCKTCGKVFTASSPKQDYRQLYCSRECRRGADTAQDKEAQRLYKQYKRGRLTAKEYIQKANSRGLPVIGAKRGKLKEES